MRALLADRIASPGPSLLNDAGIEVVEDPDLTTETLTDAVAKSAADILVVRSTRVSADSLRAGQLKLVVRAGAGFNTIDVATAAELGIMVANCPGKNAAAVAELAFGLIIALDRHIADNVADLRAGRWNKLGFSDARGLSGSTLGLLGTGHIGRAMIPIARAFGMRIIGWSRSLSPALAAELGIGHRSTPMEVARDADVVSVHVALTPETRLLVDADLLEAMKPGAYIINTARAEVVDEAALIEAVRSKGLRAGLDVFEGEPAAGKGTVVSPLFGVPGIIGTHHIGGATSQAHRAVAEEMARVVIEFARTGRVLNKVGV
jgi:D-3-phosphoglycerate dehydrogenase